jgi:hypothetical protein
MTTEWPFVIAKKHASHREVLLAIVLHQTPFRNFLFALRFSFLELRHGHSMRRRSTFSTSTRARAFENHHEFVFSGYDVDMNNTHPQKCFPLESPAMQIVEGEHGKRGEHEEHEEHDVDPHLLSPLSSCSEVDRALFLAINTNNAQALNEALSQGADINARDEEGRTPVMWAILRGHRESMKVIMSKGFDQNARDHQGVGVSEYLSRFGVLSHEHMAAVSSMISMMTMQATMELELRGVGPLKGRTRAP